MNIILVFFVVLFPVLVFSAESSRLTPIVVTTAFSSLTLLGYVILDMFSDSAFAWLWAVGMIAFVVGYYTHRHFVLTEPRTNALRTGTENGSGNSCGVKLFVLIVAALAAYHLALSGIPILASDVETSRFDFSSSGLFGLPGRMYLFGLPFCVLLVSIGASRNLLPVSQRLVVIVWTLYIVVGVLSGFKGAMVNVVVLMLLISTIVGRPVSVRQLLLGPRGLLVLFALVFGVLVSFMYQSVGVAGVQQSLAYLGVRATVVAAEAGYAALEEFGTEGTGGDQFSQDGKYFAQKYLPFLSPGRAEQFTFDQSVSASLFKTPLDENSFIVPVTVGAFPELIVNFGVASAIGLTLVWGAVFSGLEVGAQHCTSALGTALLAFGLQMTLVYVLNGNLMYGVFNYALMSLVFVALFLSCNVIGGWCRG